MCLPVKIKTEEDIRAFFLHLIFEEHLNFHPDTPFSDYVHYEDGRPVYTEEECTSRDFLMDQCFELAGDRIYDIGLEVLQPVGVGLIPSDTANQNVETI